MDDRKLRLRTDSYFRSRNATGSGDVDLIKSNSADLLELSGEFLAEGMRSKLAISFTNNQVALANLGVTVANATSLRLKFKIERTGTASLSEFGELDIHFDTETSTFELHHSYVGASSGLSFSMSGNDLQYTSTDNTGSSSETMYVIVERFGA